MNEVNIVREGWLQKRGTDQEYLFEMSFNIDIGIVKTSGLNFINLHGGID